MSTQTETRAAANKAAWDQLLHDIFVTALEGGVNYWAEVTSYHWSLPPTDHEGDRIEDLLGFHADILDLEDGDEVTGEPKAYHVNRAVIERGYALASTQYVDRVAWSTDAPPFIVTADTVDDIDLDAGDADVIVQLGLFGEVVYG